MTAGPDHRGDVDPGGGEDLGTSPPPAPSGDLRWTVAAAVLVVLVAGILRLTALGHVERIHFDEIFYANDARELVERGVEEERPAHPPLGRWLIAGGIAVLGFDPVGWRVSAALAGTITVGLTYAGGLVAFRRVSWAATAGLLVAFDGLAITSSRVAMLDVFLGMFVAAVALVVLLYVRDVASGPADGGRLPGSWHLWVTGALVGCAVATKWSAAPALVAVVGVALVAEARRRRGPVGRLAAAGRAAAVVGLPLVVVPLAVYVASYAGFLVNYTDSSVHDRRCDAEDCPAPVGERLAGLASHHRDLVRMHRSLPQTHPYRSDPASWLLLERPVLAYLERCPGEGAECVVPEGTSARIVMVGNPVLWWSALLALPVAAWQAVRRRRVSVAVVLLLGAALYLPWFLAGSGYIYYLVPLVPLASLTVVAAFAPSDGSPRAPWAPWAVVGAAASMFLFLLPIWYGVPLGPEATELRLLLSSWR